VTTAQCPADAFCEELEHGAVCVPRLATGKVCDDDEQCAASDFCKVITLAEVELETGTCHKRLAFGAGCDPLVGGCFDGLACDEASEVCAAIPDSAGEGCVADESPCGAGTGLVCEAGLCELEPFVGDACDPGATTSGCASATAMPISRAASASARSSLRRMPRARTMPSAARSTASRASAIAQ